MITKTEKNVKKIRNLKKYLKKKFFVLGYYKLEKKLHITK